MKDIDKLIEICLKIDDNYIRQTKKSEDLKRMAQLARAGEKDSKEFKALDAQYRNPTVFDMSDTYVELHRLMKKFRKKIKK